MTPIQLDPNHNSNSFADTTLAQAQANTRFALQVQVSSVNAARVADYDTQWKSYVQQRNDRPDATNITAPLPAFAEAVYTDSRGWPYIDSAPVYVTPLRTYTPPVKTPAASIFGALTPATDQLAAFDAAAITNTITRPNGHVFMRIA